jgi:hypothetical protein
VLQIWQHFTVTIAWALLACVGLMLAMVTGVEGAPAAQIQGHRQTLAPPPKVFFLAAMRITSQTYPLLYGNSVTYKRCFCASIRQLCASMRQLCASIRRASETDPARYAARFGRSETASAQKRQIEHFKIAKKSTFRPKTALKKFGGGFVTRPQTREAPGESLRHIWLSRELVLRLPGLSVSHSLESLLPLKG